MYIYKRNNNNNMCNISVSEPSICDRPGIYLWSWFTHLVYLHSRRSQYFGYEHGEPGADYTVFYIDDHAIFAFNKLLRLGVIPLVHCFLHQKQSWYPQLRIADLLRWMAYSKFSITYLVEHKSNSSVKFSNSINLLCAQAALQAGMVSIDCSSFYEFIIFCQNSKWFFNDCPLALNKMDIERILKKGISFEKKLIAQNYRSLILRYLLQQGELRKYKRWWMNNTTL